MANIHGIEVSGETYDLEDSNARQGVQTNANDIDDIQAVIPSSASSSNKLAPEDSVLPISAYSKLVNKVLIAQDSWSDDNEHTLTFSASESSKYAFLFVEVLTDGGFTANILTAGGGAFISPTAFSQTRRIDIAANRVTVSQYNWAPGYIANKIVVYGFLPKSLT